MTVLPVAKGAAAVGSDVGGGGLALVQPRVGYGAWGGGEGSGHPQVHALCSDA